MGPRLFRRGNARVRYTPPPATPSFNGATSFQTWKLVGHGNGWKKMLASMGPRLFRRGNGGGMYQVTLKPGASMGPRLFRRGNTGRRACPAGARYRLQWGHVFSDVETHGRVAPARGACTASMGPRLFRRGNAAGRLLNGIHNTRFNGATSFQTWKPTGRYPRIARQAWSFNGATSFQTWKLTPQVQVTDGQGLASMGPRLFRRGNAPHMASAGRSLVASMGPRLFRRGNCCWTAPTLGGRRFNGATSFQTWKLLLDGADVRRATLQWGHVFSDVETRP